MTVPREYAFDTAAKTDQFAGEAIAMVSGGNALLQGALTRTSTVGGNTVVVGPGENIQVAVQNVASAGGGKVILMPGNYVLASNLWIPSNVTVEGTARDSVIIDCNGSFGVKMNGSLTEAVGTVAVTKGTTTVTGTGTSWTAALEGDWMWLGKYYYQIASVTSTTELELTYGYDGVTIAGDDSIIAKLVNNPQLNKVTVRNATGIGIEADFAMEPILGDVYVYACGVGIDMAYSVWGKIVTYNIENTINAKLYAVTAIWVDTSSFDYSVSGIGLVLEHVYDCLITNCSMSFNSAAGMDLNYCESVRVFATAASDNVGDGIKLSTYNVNCPFLMVKADDNGGYGINISAASNTGTILNSNTYSGNTSGAYQNLGTGTLITP